jgi:hypothetical protein
MVPMTAQRTVDIHSNAARLPPKPMLPKDAKYGEDDHPQAKAEDYLGRSQFLRKIRKLRQVQNSGGWAFYGPGDAKRSFRSKAAHIAPLLLVEQTGGSALLMTRFARPSGDTRSELQA